MKTLIFIASPNKDGNSYKMLEAFLKGLKGEYAVINSYDVDVKPCIDCKFCYKRQGECSIKDDMTEIYKLINESDNIAVFSPMYFASYPGAFKNILDRTQVYWSKQHILNLKENKKKEGLLFISAGSNWNNMFQHMENIFKYFMNGINGKILYKVFVPDTDKVPIKNEDNILQEIYDVAQKI